MACTEAAADAPELDQTTAAVQEQIPPCDSRPFFDEFAPAKYRAGVRPDSLSPPFISAAELFVAQSHDCQRLLEVADGRPRYGTLAAVFVAPDRVAASVDAFGGGLAVAEIVAFDGRYSPLGIPRGLSCLVLRRSTDGRWDAGITAASATRGCYDPAPLPEPGAVPLELRRLTYPGGDTLYPATARWMWDDANRTHFIGTRCGYAWCEIGVPGFQGTDASLMTRENVPGWSDEQYVSYLPAGAQRVAVSRLYGRIEPARGLRGLNATHYRQPDGVHVATIRFRGNDDTVRAIYARKFRAGCSCANVIELFMRADGPDGSPAHFYSGDNGRNWRPIRPNHATTHAGRGAVRWAWSETDEAAWTECAQSCCRSDDCINPVDCR